MFPPSYFGPIGTYSLSSSGGVGSGAQPITSNSSAIAPDGLRIEHGNGNPVSGATIKVYDASDTSFLNAMASVTSLSDGRWSGISIPAGSYVIVVTACDQSVNVPIVVP